MNMPATIVFVYGLLVLLGGIFGYVKANSLPSLVMGFIFGILAIISSVMMKQNHKWGTVFAIALAAVLALFFAIRFFNTAKFMPAGLMALLSFTVLAILLWTMNKK